ncbi:MAG: hypothetical protein DLM68_04545 [Hyphomicrobiales bacterium]|nr:MAG: hypothetical protein DLM68_04545 [Hyphomicrobiales bacterium]
MVWLSKIRSQEELAVGRQLTRLCRLHRLPRLQKSALQANTKQPPRWLKGLFDEDTPDLQYGKSKRLRRNGN